ncbi:HNH endonuclease [Exiguobacterium sp. K1]|uniref:HNH endonuclease n=1 Tax=Exiguobacterium sp. K1 TaxID=2980105 RepID=UPI00299E7E48|nr:HNH endonuclease [Exiguobacterium sp. K1]MDX1260712.1 HNH endonuclease [Exiguobacterium sp. K1]
MSFYIVMDTSQNQNDLNILECPTKDNLGNVPHYYSRMIDLKENDFVFHYNQGLIYGVSKITHSTIINENHNFLAEIDFTRLQNPLHIRSKWPVVKELLPHEYSPFQANSVENTGFLYPCSDDLSMYLFSEIAKYNTEVINEDEMNQTEVQLELLMRRGQHVYKKRLIALWKGQCSICHINLPELLRASHAKPWKDSNPNERLDPYNGLLLCAHHDALFDKGLISFDQKGHILISEVLLASNPQIYQVSLDTKLTLFEENKKYLLWHQCYVFKNKIL